MSPNEIVEKIAPLFSQLKNIMDAYPNAFSITYLKEIGYVIQIDLTLLEHLPAKEVLTV